MNDKLRLGFIGGGINSAIGQTHKIASQMDDKFILVAGCFSRDQEINRRTAEAWGVAEKRRYDNWQNLIEEEKSRLDAFVVLLPTPDHYGVLKALLEHDCRVICDKAAVATTKQALEIKRLVDTRKGFLTVTYNYTGFPMVRELRHMISEGRLGRIRQVLIEMPQQGFIKSGADGTCAIPQGWRLVDGEIPTISLDLGVHLHNMVSFLTGQVPTSVIGCQATFGKFSEVVDNVHCLVRFTNDLVCNAWYSKSALGHTNGLRVRVFGEKGSAEWYQMDPEVLEYSDSRGSNERLDRASNITEIAPLDRYNRFKSGHPSGFIEAFANLYVDIAEMLAGHLNGVVAPERRNVFGIGDALEGLVLFDKLNTSSSTGTWQPLND